MKWGAALVLALALPALGAWQSWTSPRIAVDDVVAAVRERLEATYYGKGVSTVAVVRCEAGSPVTNSVVVTNRLYQVSVSKGNWSELEATPTTDAIMWYSPAWPVLLSTNLIVAGRLTNTWTNASGVVTSRVVDLLRQDNVIVVTNSDCSVTSSATRRLLLTNNPPAAISSAFMAEVDDGLDRLIPVFTAEAIPSPVIPHPTPPMFVDHTQSDPDGSFVNWFQRPAYTNWKWTGVWEVDSYTHPGDYPRLDRARVWALTGVGQVVTNVGVVDRGTNYPRSEVSIVSGWTVGDLATEVVTVTNVAERYVATTNLAYLWSYSQATNGYVLGEWATVRTNGAGVLIEARGFGALDGYWPTNRGVAAVAVSNAGWTFTGEASSWPVGCWKSNAATAALMPAARWQTVARSSLMPEMLPPWPGGTEFQRGPIPAFAGPAWLEVHTTTTGDVYCGQAPAAGWPEMLRVQVVGQVVQVATATSGTAIVTATQTVDVVATGRYELGAAFLTVTELSLTNDAGHDGAYYPVNGAHLVVRTAPDLRTAWSRLPPWATTNALAERRRVLDVLRWTVKEEHWLLGPLYPPAWTDRIAVEVVRQEWDDVGSYALPNFGIRSTNWLSRWSFTHGP